MIRSSSRSPDIIVSSAIAVARDTDERTISQARDICEQILAAQRDRPLPSGVLPYARMRPARP